MADGDDITIGAQIAGELAQGVPVTIDVGGHQMEGLMDAHTGLLLPATHLALENEIKANFVEGDVPTVATEHSGSKET